MLRAFFTKKSIGFYILVAAILSAIVCLIFYVSGSGDSYGSNPWITKLLAAGAVVGIVFAYKDFFGLGSILVSIFGSIAMGIFISARFVYFSNLYFNISPEPPNNAITVATVFLVVMIVAAVISAFFKQEKED